MSEIIQKGDRVKIIPTISRTSSPIEKEEATKKELRNEKRE